MDAPSRDDRAVLPYTLDARLGGSGGTEVWIARAIDGDERIALKLIRDADRIPLESFRHELQAVQGLDHPAIVRVIDFGESKSGMFVASELVEPCVTLAALVARHTARRLPLSPAIVAYVGVSLAEALDHAATSATLDGKPVRLLHRHLSPSNVLLDSEGRVRLVDLAIPASRTAVSPASGQVVRGTPGYLAPEQVRGEIADERADVFVLGAVLHECATLHSLYGRADPNASMTATIEHVAQPLADLVSGFPAVVSRIVHKALARDAGDRFAHAGELAAALRDAAPAIPGYTEARGALATLVKAALFASKSESEARTRLIEGEPSASSSQEITGELESSLDEPTGAILAPPVVADPPLEPTPAVASLPGVVVERAPPGMVNPATSARTPTWVAPEPRAGALTTLSSMLEDPQRRTPIMLLFGAVVVLLIVVLLATRPTDAADIELRALYARGEYGAVERHFVENVSRFQYPAAAFELAADAWRRQREPLAPVPSAAPAAPPVPPSAPPSLEPSARELAAIEIPGDIPEPVVRSRADRKARIKAKKSLQAGLRYLETGDVMAAEKAFRRCIVALDFAACRLHLALLHARAGEIEEAVSNYERYLELWPEAPGAERLRALTAALGPNE